MDTRRTLSIIAEGAANTQRLSRISSTTLSLNEEFEFDGLENPNQNQLTRVIVVFLVPFFQIDIYIYDFLS